MYQPPNYACETFSLHHSSPPAHCCDAAKIGVQFSISQLYVPAVDVSDLVTLLMVINFSKRLLSRPSRTAIEALEWELYGANAIVKSTFTRTRASLRRHRNGMVPINILPNDILLQILGRAAMRDVRLKRHLLHTCTHWRELCVGSATFLTTLELPKVPGELRLFLGFGRRLTPQPFIDLAVDWDNVRPRILRILREILSESDSVISKMSVSNLPQPRWQDWESDSENSDGSDVDPEDFGELEMLTLLDDFFLPLRELELRSSGGRLSRIRVDCILPNAFGDSGDKHLEILTLVNCRFPYTPRCYSGIRTLRIEYDGPPMRRRKRDKQWDGQFIDVLLACPALECLVLRHIPMSLEEAIANRPPFSVPLLNLRILRVDLDVQRMRALLRGVVTSAESLRVVNFCLGDLDRWSVFEPSWADTLLDATLKPFEFFTSESLPLLEQLESLAILPHMGFHGRGASRQNPRGVLTAPRFDVTFFLSPEGSEHGSIDSEASERSSVPDHDTASTESADAGDAESDHDKSPIHVAFNSFFDFLSQSSLGSIRRLRLCLLNSEMTMKILRATPRIQELVLDEPTDPNVLVDIAHAQAHSSLHRMICRELEEITLVGCTLLEERLDATRIAAGRLILRTLTLAQCDTELDPAIVLQRLGRDGLYVRWLEDLPEDELLSLYNKCPGKDGSL